MDSIDDEWKQSSKYTTGYISGRGVQKWRASDTTNTTVSYTLQKSNNKAMKPWQRPLLV